MARDHPKSNLGVVLAHAVAYALSAAPGQVEEWGEVARSLSDAVLYLDASNCVSDALAPAEEALMLLRTLALGERDEQYRSMAAQLAAQLSEVMKGIVREHL